MSNFIAPVAAWCAAIIEAIGIGTITLFALYSLLNAATKLLKKADGDSIFHELRQLLGRGILLGLEFLIASDIIYTVAVELTFQTIGVLAIVVLIRTFLSLTLEVEMSGKWPWQERR
ncbi:DUF1622 domain-containing protein [Desulfuromonas sp. KJ2020]|uniref:DUF1622 domain-containing protein n=1 Tax=Desulfuromonas sp. KJ2020 TaxID=2919173 RepID=UPI0020A79DE8|nr:DUF1622 domain-containing protein [Desulfuromonas sp. KJ2020]MCP3176509.1 DUF1622 domain-containing protein [Desulfuromonas sp. KJ2020]